MTDLERRALLGDRQAQEECTRRGIALPCPKCGSKWTQVRHMGWPGPAAFQAGYRGECTDCHMVTGAHKTEKEALEDWNTRAEPPIGRCMDCASWRGNQNDTDAPCRDCDGVMEADNFCKNFEPREKVENE